MTELITYIKTIALESGAKSFVYNRKSEANRSIDEMPSPCVILLEIETPGFLLNTNGYMSNTYPVNIQFVTQFEKDIDTDATDRVDSHNEAYRMAGKFLANVYKSDMFADFGRVNGLILNNAYNVKATGYEIQLTLTPKEYMTLCL